MIRDVILPWAMGEVDLGDDVLEVGPGLRRDHRRPEPSGPGSRRSRSTTSWRRCSPSGSPSVPTVEIVRGDATALDLSRRAVHRRGLLHDAAPRPHRRAAGPALRRGGPRPAARRRARWPATASPATSWRRTTRATPTTRSTPTRCRRGCAPPGSPTSRCAPTRSAGPPSPAPPGSATDGSGGPVTRARPPTPASDLVGDLEVLLVAAEPLPLDRRVEPEGLE